MDEALQFIIQFIKIVWKEIKIFQRNVIKITSRLMSVKHKAEKWKLNLQKHHLLIYNLKLFKHLVKFLLTLLPNMKLMNVMQKLMKLNLSHHAVKTVEFHRVAIHFFSHYIINSNFLKRMFPNFRFIFYLLHFSTR